MKDEPKYSLDLGLKALLLDKKLQINLTARDILKISVSYDNQYIGEMKQVMKCYHVNRRVTLSLRFELGNKKVKIKKKAFGNEQERA